MGEVSDLITVPIEVSDEELEAAAQKAEEALEKGERAEEQAQQAKDVGDEVLAQEPRITGTYRLARSTVSLIPGLQEAYSLAMRVKYLVGAGLFTGDITAVLSLVVMLLHMVIDLYQKQERQAKDYEKMVREARHLTTHEQYLAWQREQDQLAEAYRNQPVR